MKKMTFAIVAGLMTTVSSGAFAADGHATPDDIYNWKEMQKIEPSAGPVTTSFVYGQGGGDDIFADMKEQSTNNGTPSSLVMHDGYAND